LNTITRTARGFLWGTAMTDRDDFDSPLRLSADIVAAYLSNNTTSHVASVPTDLAERRDQGNPEASINSATSLNRSG